MDADEFKEAGEKFRQAQEAYVKVTKVVEAGLLLLPRSELVWKATQNWSQLDLAEAIAAEMTYAEMIEWVNEEGE